MAKSQHSSPVPPVWKLDPFQPDSNLQQQQTASFPTSNNTIPTIFHNLLILLLLTVAVVGIYHTSWSAEDYATSIFHGGLIVLVVGLAFAGIQVIWSRRAGRNYEESRIFVAGMAVSLVGIVLMVASLVVVLFTV